MLATPDPRREPAEGLEARRATRGMVNVDRLARALSVDLPTVMAGVEAERRR
jgi:hypothetical protein